MPEVSVIIPNYNHQRYLKQRLETVLNQTYRDFEIIILDDCSTDNSRDVIETYRSNAKVSAIVYNEKNSGSTFLQWQKGIALANGKYIWIAESDDYCEPSFLDKTLQKIKEYPGAGIVYAQSTEIDDAVNNSFLSFHDHPKFSQTFKNSFFNSGRKEIAEKLVYENTIPNASAVLFRKDIYQACGGPDTSMRLCGDWMLWVKMLEISDVYFIAEPLNFFRLSMSSVRLRQGVANSLRERLQVLRYIQQISRAKEVDESQRRLLRFVLNSCPVSKIHKAWSLVWANRDLINKPYRKIFGSFVLAIGDRITRKWVMN